MASLAVGLVLGGWAAAQAPPPGAAGVQHPLPEEPAPAPHLPAGGDTRTGVGGLVVEPEPARVTGRIVRIEDDRISLRSNVTNEVLTFSADAEGEIVLNQKPAELRDLRPGDFVRLTLTEGEDPRATLVWAARIREQAVQPDQTFPPTVPEPERDGIRRDRVRVRAQLANQGGLGVAVIDTPGVGALIVGVRTGTPAAQVGLMVGDYILALDNQQITTADHLINLVRSYRPGATVTLTAWRQTGVATQSFVPTQPGAGFPTTGTPTGTPTGTTRDVDDPDARPAAQPRTPATRETARPQTPPGITPRQAPAGTPAESARPPGVPRHITDPFDQTPPPGAAQPQQAPRGGQAAQPQQAAPPGQDVLRQVAEAEGDTQSRAPTARGAQPRAAQQPDRNGRATQATPRQPAAAQQVRGGTQADRRAVPPTADGTRTAVGPAAADGTGTPTQGVAPGTAATGSPLSFFPRTGGGTHVVQVRLTSADRAGDAAVDHLGSAPIGQPGFVHGGIGTSGIGTGAGTGFFPATTGIGVGTDGTAQQILQAMQQLRQEIQTLRVEMHQLHGQEPPVDQAFDPTTPTQPFDPTGPPTQPTAPREVGRGAQPDAWPFPRTQPDQPQPGVQETQPGAQQLDPGAQQRQQRLQRRAQQQQQLEGAIEQQQLRPQQPVQPGAQPTPGQPPAGAAAGAQGAAGAQSGADAAAGAGTGGSP